MKRVIRQKGQLVAMYFVIFASIRGLLNVIPFE